MTHYLTFVFDENDCFDFTAPDVPGFTASAETRNFDEAVALARRVLAMHVTAILDAGGEMPVCRSLADLRADPIYADDFAEAATTLMLPAIVSAGRTKRVNLTFDENTLGLIDGAAADRGLTRSALLAEAARQLVSA
jgi:predicted RNase H-like HicB family nuclease